MKIGDKVYHQKWGCDVVITDMVGNAVMTYSDSGNYRTASKSDLLEYDTYKPQQKAVYSAPTTSYCPSTKTTITGGSKMNIKSLIGQFGKVAPGECAITFSGQVVVRRNTDEYVCFDAEKGQIVNHMSLVIKDASKFIFVLPVTEVKANDVIRVKNTYFQVLEQKEDGSIVGINLNTGAKSTQCKETNAFGINFYYKVTSLFPTAGTTGTIDPMTILLMSKDGGSTDDLLPLLMMQGAGGGDFAKNPLAMMALLGDGGGNMKDLFLLQALSGGTAGTAGAINPLMFLALSK